MSWLFGDDDAVLIGVDCPCCGGSGGGDHPGIRCLECHGSGVVRGVPEDEDEADE